MSTPDGKLQVRAIVIMAVALLAVLYFHLVPALLAGLLVRELVDAVAPRLAFGRVRDTRARMLTVGLIATFVIGALAGAVVLLVAFLRSEVAGPQHLLVRLADILDSSRGSLPNWLHEQLPADPQALRERLMGYLRDHTAQVQQVGRTIGLGFGHVVIGAVIGGMVCLREAKGGERAKPFERELETRLSNLARAFRSIVFAQMKISAINTTMTGLYLWLVLPMMGVNLPLKKTMVAVTFVAGLLPIIGNLISNTLIVIVSLSSSFMTAVASLTFLVVLHKLEYFLNARIVGGEIKASAWELLCAMLLGEASFGVPGLIAAPILYAYFKDELKGIGLF
jgi:predicted PurR-regulated permease PerM